MRSIFMISRSSGSGQATRLSCAIQSFSSNARIFAGRSGVTAANAYKQKCLPTGMVIRLLCDI